ncbi:MAG: glycosyltransferase [Pseudomonadota bacterium]
MISFVIPAHNEAAEMAGCLAAIHTAALAVAHPYEVIVVDDASTDDTAAIAIGHHAEVVRVDHRQIAATRNAGAAAASGESLVFVDADTQINETVLRKTLTALTAGAVGGGARIQLKGKLTYTQRLVMRIMMAIWRLTGWAAGCFIYCRRADFEAVGGFDERYYASEEIHLSRALMRRGKFKLLSTPVLTSARKLHLYSHKEQWRTVRHLLVGGLPAARRRSGLEFWYDSRREPQKAASKSKAQS